MTAPTIVTVRRISRSWNSARASIGWRSGAFGASTRLNPQQTGFTGYVANAPIESFDLTGDSGAQGGISIDNLCRPSKVPQCVPGDTTLCLQDGRFQVEVDWRDFAGVTGPGQAATLTTETGYFSFFDPDNVEIAVKVLDGRAANGFWWIFFGAMSNVEYTIRVTDVETGRTATYFNPSGQFSSVGDICAIPEGTSATADGARFIEVGRDAPMGLSSSQSPSNTDMHHSSLASPARGTSAGAKGICQPGPTTLCLSEGRFAVEVDWVDFQGNQGTAVPIQDGSGYFWYFQDTNIELVTKILDGRPLNGYWWFFYASLSNVEVTMVVTDTVTGTTRTYVNPLSQFASEGDTAAFAD